MKSISKDEALAVLSMGALVFANENSATLLSRSDIEALEDDREFFIKDGDVYTAIEAMRTLDPKPDWSKLGEALAAPIKKRLNYEGALRKMFKVRPLK